MVFIFNASSPAASVRPGDGNNTNITAPRVANDATSSRGHGFLVTGARSTNVGGSSASANATASFSFGNYTVPQASSFGTEPAKSTAMDGDASAPAPGVASSLGGFGGAYMGATVHSSAALDDFGAPSPASADGISFGAPAPACGGGFAFGNSLFRAPVPASASGVDCGAPLLTLPIYDASASPAPRPASSPSSGSIFGAPPSSSPNGGGGIPFGSSTPAPGHFRTAPSPAPASSFVRFGRAPASSGGLVGCTPAPATAPSAFGSNARAPFGGGGTSSRAPAPGDRLFGTPAPRAGLFGSPTDSLAANTSTSARSHLGSTPTPAPAPSALHRSPADLFRPTVAEQLAIEEVTRLHEATRPIEEQLFRGVSGAEREALLMIYRLEAQLHLMKTELFQISSGSQLESLIEIRRMRVQASIASTRERLEAARAILRRRCRSN